MKILMGLLIVGLSIGSAQAQERVLPRQDNIQVSEGFCQAYGSLSQKIMQYRQQGVDRASNERALSFVLNETFGPGEEELRDFTASAVVVSLNRAYKEPQAPESQRAVVSQTFGQRQQTQCLQELR